MNNLISKIREELKNKSRRVFKPIIISDIDGVLLRGKAPIPGTYEALLKI